MSEALLQHLANTQTNLQEIEESIAARKGPIFAESVIRSAQTLGALRIMNQLNQGHKLEPLLKDTVESVLKHYTWFCYRAVLKEGGPTAIKEFQEHVDLVLTHIEAAEAKALEIIKATLQ